MAEKLTCVRKIWNAHWQQFPCGRPAKFYVDGVHSQIPLCGIHARADARAGLTLKPIASSHSAQPEPK